MPRRQRLEKPFYPDETQVVVDVVLAEAFDSVKIRRVLQIEQAVEIPFNYDIAEIDRDGAHKVQLILVPELLRDGPHTAFQRLIPADLVAGAARAFVNGVEVIGNGVRRITKGTNDDVREQVLPVTFNGFWSHQKTLHGAPRLLNFRVEKNTRDTGPSELS